MILKNEVNINLKNCRITTIITLLVSFLSIFASSASIINQNIYIDFFNASGLSQNLLTGSIGQDIITLPLGIILLVLSIISFKRESVKILIALIGVTSYFFYAYGIYVIQGNYTSIYIIYMAIFCLSIYSIVWGFISFKNLSSIKADLPKGLRIIIAIFLVFILCVLVPGWFLRMAPDIVKHLKSDTYGVYVLDLCIVFPALFQIAIMLFRKRMFANILAGIGLIKVLTVCLSWGFAEWYVAYNKNIPVTIDMAAISSTLTLISLCLIIPYFLKLKV